MNDDNLFDDLFEDTPLNPFEFFDFADLPLPDPFHRDASRIPTLTPLRSTGVASLPSFPLTLPLPLPPLPPLPSVPRGQTTLPSLFSTTRRQFNPAIPPSQSAARYPTTHLEPNSDDYYLNQLATRDFSSPSLPPQSPRSFGHTLGRNHAAPAPNPPSYLRHTASTSPSGADILGQADQLVAGPFHLQAARTERHHLDATHNSQDSRSNPTPTDMPSGTRRKRRAGAASDADSDLVEMSPPVGHSRRSPRRRNAQASTQTTQRASTDHDDLFGSPPPPKAKKSRRTSLRGQDSRGDKKRKRDSVDGELDLLNEDDIKVVDLANSDQVPNSILQKPKPKNEVKLSAFQCVICMDDCTDLTVTHCGHLFCAECLHSSLHIDVTKKVCPICRQKIETRPASGKFTTKQKGFYNLELKLMTKRTLGKRAA